MDEDNRVTTSFLDGTQLEESQLEDYRFHAHRHSVTVMLVDGSQHRHISANHDQRSDTGALSRLRIRTSYEVLRSGALAIIQSNTWEDPPENDVRIVATYAPHHWARATGTCEVDTHRDRSKADREEKLGQQRASARDARD